MDRASRPLAIVAMVIAAALVIGGVAILVADRPSESTAEGIVVQVTPSGTLAVSSFQLRTDDGRTLTFTLGDLDLSPPGFNGPHLYVHRASLQPIIVSFRTEGSAFIAVRLVDAPVPSPSAVPSLSAVTSPAAAAVGQPSMAAAAVVEAVVVGASAVERS